MCIAPEHHRRVTCSCRSTAELCELCRDSLYAQLRGVAACRADRWADELAAKRSAPLVPWPVGSERVHAAAIEQVADLTRDERLRELLATELERWAAKRWDESLPTQPGESALKSAIVEKS